MRKAIALVLGMLLPVLGVADGGLAQSAVSVQGVIQSVDCQGQTVVLGGAGGSNTLATTGATAVFVNSASVPFCTLGQYVGASATAWLLPGGNEFQVTRIDVVGPAASATPPAPEPAASSPSMGALILGALVVGAIGYVIGHSSANQSVYQPTYDQPVYQPTYGQPVYQYDHGRWVPRGGQQRYQQCQTRGRYQVCSDPQEGSQHG
jgi:hypothetical protein